jgi:hypothetical protein
MTIFNGLFSPFRILIKMAVAGRGPSSRSSASVAQTLTAKYLSEAEYAVLYGVAPNIQHALETVDGIILAVRKELARQVEE